MSRAHAYRPTNTAIETIWPQSPVVPTCSAPSLRLQSSIHRVVLGHDPLPVLVLGGDGEEFPVGVGLVGVSKALAAVVKNGQGWRALPLRQLPGKKRMLRLGVADEVGVLFTVVVLPRGEQFVAVAVAQLAKKQIGAVFNRAVAQRIHADADRKPGERIVVLGPRQHWSLIVQPPDVAKKSKHQQRASADRNPDLCASKSHPETKFIWMATYGKITAGGRESTCTCGEF